MSSSHAVLGRVPVVLGMHSVRLSGLGRAAKPAFGVRSSLCNPLGGLGCAIEVAGQLNLPNTPRSQGPPRGYRWRLGLFFYSCWKSWCPVRVSKLALGGSFDDGLCPC